LIASCIFSLFLLKAILQNYIFIARFLVKVSKGKCNKLGFLSSLVFLIFSITLFFHSVDSILSICVARLLLFTLKLLVTVKTRVKITFLVWVMYFLTNHIDFILQIISFFQNISHNVAAVILSSSHFIVEIWLQIYI